MSDLTDIELIRWLDERARAVSNTGNPREDNHYGRAAARIEALARERDGARDEVKRLNTWADGFSDAQLKERATGEAYIRELRQRAEAAEAALVEARSPKPDAYACQKCERRDGLDCVIPHHLWNQIEAETGHSILCAWCLDAECAKRGWEVRALLAFNGTAVSAGTDPQNDDEHWEHHLGALNARCHNAEAALAVERAARERIEMAIKRLHVAFAQATVDVPAGEPTLAYLALIEIAHAALPENANSR